MSNISVASSVGSSEGRRRAELEIDEMELRRHSNGRTLPAVFHQPARRHTESADTRPLTQLRAEDLDLPAETPAATAAAVDYHKENPIGLYGWRKRCLYFFILLLVVILVTNLALTIWILVVLNFSHHGMGNLRITETGIRLEGTAEFLGPLYAQNISADQNSTLLLQSRTSIDLNIDGGSDVTIDNSTLNITAQLFQVATPTSSAPALSISEDAITVGASQMEVKGTLGMILNGPLEAEQISSHPNADLQLESASGSVVMIGRGGVLIQDGPEFDGVQITSNEKLSISSRTEIVLDSETVRVSGLPVATATDGEQAVRVYEVCACASGKLFLSPAAASGPACAASNDICSTL